MLAVDIIPNRILFYDRFICPDDIATVVLFNRTYLYCTIRIIYLF